MSAEKWTPAPWRLVDLRHQQRGQIKVMSQFHDIANVLALGKNADADAHLIAAAPALYEALRVLLQDYEDIPGPSGTLVQQARAALALARGEQP